MLTLRVDVGATLDEQLHFLQREKVRDCRVHQWSAPERIHDVRVGAVVQHQSDRIRVTEKRDLRQHVRVHRAIQVLRNEKIHALRATE